MAFTVELATQKFYSRRNRTSITEEPHISKWKLLFLGPISFYFNLIAPKASAEGACILAEMGYCYGVWLVTFMKCGCKSGANW